MYSTTFKRAAIWINDEYLFRRCRQSLSDEKFAFQNSNQMFFGMYVGNASEASIKKQA